MTSILIVTTNVDLRELFVVLIGKKHLIIEAEDGKTAMELFNQFHPDIIITDLRLPIINGYDFIKHIHKTALPVKIIVLSSYFASARDRKMLVDIGIDNNFLIPFETELLLQAIVESI